MISPDLKDCDFLQKSAISKDRVLIRYKNFKTKVLSGMTMNFDAEADTLPHEQFKF